MTGRELILYILSNGLEDEPVFKDGQFIGFMSVNEAAAKLSMGTASIVALVGMNRLEGVRVNQGLYIPANSKLNVR